MKNKKLIYALSCALGSTMVGFFANKLNSVVTAFLFSIGIFIMVFSIIKINN